MSAPPDLLSLVLIVRPLPAAAEERPLPEWWGRAAQALLLDVVRRSDERLAAELHDDNGLRPYTASNLLGHFEARRPQPEQTYTLRFTALTAPLAGLLLAAAQPGGPLAAGAQVELDYLPFRIEAAHFDPVAHPWAATARYDDFSAGHLLGSAPPRRLTLHFASPTTFHVDGRHLPLPLPEQVFTSLLERWNAFSPLALPAETRRFAAECLHLSRFRLNSVPVPLKQGGLRIGAVGEATYTASHYDRFWLTALYTLAEFALFSGLGSGAAYGLGQARRLASPSRTSD
ncbi:CRISPR-associated protein, Cas6 family [Bellilinea caldifistulae]|uniref:CRISPR system precrRNA processing endoribonuclease RAMP protein Cas6 n=1 Tax=Bellilinea caldifistulae TaxID=360411 RepID=UPI0007805105|nr:CRISPR system precrRNA processing endoribonuclease RAMP protein Cas6 [Bellilinea caldifistulae]GAP11878.1 CRISPR-associated protein, Cas6 family [Bellilinea caldifistulae]